MSERLEKLGYEVIQFHASGIGGKSLERLAAARELAGVVDITTHELADLVVDGVYSAGDTRLTGAGAAGLPQVIVPGAIDHANLWAEQVPERYKAREFFRYNAQNLLMRTNEEEFKKLGREFASASTRPKGRCACLSRCTVSASIPSAARTIFRATTGGHGNVRRTTGFSWTLSNRT